MHGQAVHLHIDGLPVTTKDGPAFVGGSAARWSLVRDELHDRNSYVLTDAEQGFMLALQAPTDPDSEQVAARLLPVGKSLPPRV